LGQLADHAGERPKPVSWSDCNVSFP
jgi:hypothetical protein